MKQTKVIVLGVPFDVLTKKEALEAIERRMDKKEKTFLVTPNPEILVFANKNPRYLEVLKKADLSIADGTGILWGASFLAKKTRKKMFFPRTVLWFYAVFSLVSAFFSPASIKNILPERVTGADVFLDICQKASQKKWKIFLLGAGEGVAKETKNRLEKRYSGIRIVGTFSGSPRKKDEKTILSLMRQVSPDMVFVAYGAPKQELWIFRNMCEVSSVKFMAGIGGAFDFVAGKQTRAPRLMRKYGVEWLFRFFTQPKRIFRIYNATFGFIALVLREKLLEYKEGGKKTGRKL